MAQIVQTGIIINLDYAGHPNMAQIRIPTIHGLPSSYIGNIGVSEFNNPYRDRINKYCSYTKDESNSLFTIDEDLPWFPICYPFGSKMGPSTGDIVYIVLENTQGLNGLIIGWTGNQITYNDVVAGMKDKSVQTSDDASKFVASTAELFDTVFS